MAPDGKVAVPPCRRVDSFLIRNPVDLPSLPAVTRVRLFEMRRIRIDLRPDKPNQNRPSLPHVLTVEFAAAILKLADHGWVQDPILTVGPIDPPLVRLRVIKPQGKTFDVILCAVSFEFFQVGAAIPDLARDRRSVKLDPGRGAGESIGETRQVNVPTSDLEVEIVISFVFPGIGRNAFI